MQRMNRMVLGLVAVFVLGSSLALLGCGGDDDNTTSVRSPTDAQNVLQGKTFTYNDATPFGIPANTPATLAFNSTATRFALTASPSGTARRATGSVTYGSCSFVVGNSTNPDAPVSASNTVGGGSTFPSTQGPQPNQTLTTSPDGCSFDGNANTLTVTIGSVSTTSNPNGTSPSGGFGAGS